MYHSMASATAVKSFGVDQAACNLYTAGYSTAAQATFDPMGELVLAFDICFGACPYHILLTEWLCTLDSQQQYNLFDDL